LIDTRENVKYFIFLYQYMLFVTIVSVNLPTKNGKVPKVFTYPS